jgi:hypothetical protein
MFSWSDNQIFFKHFVTIWVARGVTGIIVHFMFYFRNISLYIGSWILIWVYRYYYITQRDGPHQNSWILVFFCFFWVTFLSADIAMPIKVHCYCYCHYYYYYYCVAFLKIAAKRSENVSCLLCAGNKSLRAVFMIRFSLKWVHVSLLSEKQHWLDVSSEKVSPIRVSFSVLLTVFIIYRKFDSKRPIYLHLHTVFLQLLGIPVPATVIDLQDPMWLEPAVSPLFPTPFTLLILHEVTALIYN